MGVSIKRMFTSESNYNTRESAAKAASELGMRAYFYPEEDAQHILDVMKWLGVDIYLNPQTLHTFMPPLLIPPSEIELRPGDKYGFKRLNLMQFLMRGSIKNVLSCHSPNNAQPHNTGQLNYLANPAWSCFGIYTNPQSKATFGENPFAPLIRGKELEGLPNLVATVNVLLGFSPKGEPAVFLSRIYGDSSDPNLLNKLVDYFANNQRCRVYVATRWALKDQYDVSHRRITCQEGGTNWAYHAHLADRQKTTSFFCPPVEPQIVTADRTNLIFRYPDIPEQYIKRDSTKGARTGIISRIAEIQDSVLWKSQLSTEIAPRTIVQGMNSTKRKNLRVEVSNNFVKDSGIQKRILQDTFICRLCGKHVSMGQTYLKVDSFNRNHLMCVQEKQERVILEVANV